jgi:hypothetical protein
VTVYETGVDGGFAGRKWRFCIPLIGWQRYHLGMKSIFGAVFFSLLAINGGCETLHQYDITVTNRLTQPVTVWLTKVDGPYGEGWVPPENLAWTQGGDQHISGVTIPPGETRHTVKSTKLDSDNQAVLRIYRAATFDALLAISPDSPDRLDLPLEPGNTDIDVISNDDQLLTRPHAASQ